MLAKAEKFLLFLTVIFLPTQLGQHFWPQFAYIYSLRIDYLSPTIYFWNILAAALLVVFLAGNKKINKTALWLILLFLSTQAISLLPHLTDQNILGVGLTRLEEYIFASFFALYLSSADFGFLKKNLPLPLGLSVLGEAALAIAQFIKGGTLGFWLLGERSFTLSTAGIAKFDFYGQEFLRPYATFPHPNVLAGFMIVVCLLLIFMGLPQKGKTAIYTKTVYTKTVLLLAALTVILTVSRVAILTGFVNAFSLLQKRGRIGVVIILLLLSPILYARYSSAFSFDNLSITRREELSTTALKMWTSSPFSGVGLNNFIPKASSDLLVGPSRFLQPVHNIYLLSLAETGVIGLLGLLGWLAYPIFKLSRQKKLLWIWLSVLFLGLFDHFFLTLPQGYRLLFMLWGISLSVIE